MPAAPAPPCDPDLLDATLSATRRAAALAMEGFRSADLGIDHKGDGSVVTRYDRAVERVLREHIAAAHPEDAILGEEEDDVEGRSGRRWVLDPIDGTSPFSRGIVTWATLVALDDEHGPLLSVVACPWVDEVVWAGRGLGCSWDGRPARASTRTELHRAVLCTSGIEWWPDGMLQRVVDAGIKLKTWGNGYGIALAATGRVDAFFDHGVRFWDLAPAPILMREAGGEYCALDGSASIDQGNGLLCGKPLRDQLLEVLRG